MKIRQFLSAVILVLLLSLSGCGVADDLKQSMQQREQTIEMIRKETGWKADVGFNIHNGRLSVVTVTLDKEDVAHKTIGDLQRLVSKAVRQSFEREPENLVLQVVF